MLTGKKILVLGETKFFSGIQNYLSKYNQVRVLAPKSIQRLAYQLYWADFVWVEWAGRWSNLVGRLYPPCKTICRVHRFEIYEPHFITSHQWGTYDHVFFVSKYMHKCVIERMTKVPKPQSTSVLYNGINLDKFHFEEKKPGFHIGIIAHTVFRKNLEMAVQIMRKLVEIDKRYHLTLIGKASQRDCLDAFLFSVERAGLSKHIHYDGFLENNQISKWLADKNYILSTSLHEGHPVGLNEAMACGVKPIIFEYPGSREVFPEEILFDTVQEAVELIKNSTYDSESYHNWVSEHFSLQLQLDEIDKILERVDQRRPRRSRYQFLNKVIKITWRRGSRRLRKLFDHST